MYFMVFPLRKMRLYSKHASHVEILYKCFCHSERNKLNIESFPHYLSGNDSNTMRVVNENFEVHENFVSEDEERELLREIEPFLKRRRYEKDHWDGAIKHYKETEKSEWNESNKRVLQRLWKIAFPSEEIIFKSAHILDLSKTGHIKPHIDSVRFCGNTIAGISLLSSSVMRLMKEQDKSIVVDVLLPRQSLYVMKGAARYDFTHEILEDAVSFFKGKKINRDRRVSIICRNEPSQNLKNS